MPTMTEEPPQTAIETLGSRETVIDLRTHLDTAQAAFARKDGVAFKNEIVATREKIKKIRPDLPVKPRANLQNSVREALAAAALYGGAHRETAEDREQTRLAKEGNDLLTSVMNAAREIECKTQFRPDEIVLAPKHYTQLMTLCTNAYSGWFPTIMDAPDEATLFGMKLKIGAKSQVSLTPTVEYYAVPGSMGYIDETTRLEIHARTIAIETRQQMIVPIYMGWCFRGHIITRQTRGNLVDKVPHNEMVAIETLREAISETEFRRYIKYGFILVKAKSGDTYQVFRNRSHTKIWRGGKLIEEICVRIADRQIPPTDNVIAFKTMIEIDEEEFKKSGNRFKFHNAA